MIRNIIFDWSGVLCDDLEQCYKCCMAVFRSLGIGEISLETFREEFILPYTDFYRKYRPGVTKEQIDPVYREAAKQEPLPGAYRGVAATLEKLHRAGYRMAILSTEQQERLEKRVQAYGIARHFIGLHSVHDKIAAIREVMAQHKFSPDETVFVGDLLHDIEAGRAAGVRTIGAGYGYQERERIAACGPDAIIDDIAELPGVLKSLE